MGYRREMPLSVEKTASLRERFAALHQAGTFIMPNAWDVGSALVLQSLGFEAIATTSSGLAASLGRHDQSVTLAELAVHVADLCSELDIPLSIDGEAGYSRDLDGLPRTGGQLAATGASGISIEDYIPERGLLGMEEATERVDRLSAAAHSEGLVVTARAENHLYGIDDLDDTIVRLRSYREAGADVVYAPGLSSIHDIARVVSEVNAPVNVLLLPDGPSVPELTDAGVRRISTGGALAFAAYGAMAAGARELLERGTATFTQGALTPVERKAAFGSP
jgi:2-methylisocitrate lyase-like PEP mutase family enzyme